MRLIRLIGGPKNGRLVDLDEVPVMNPEQSGPIGGLCDVNLDNPERGHIFGAVRSVNHYLWDEDKDTYVYAGTDRPEVK